MDIIDEAELDLTALMEADFGHLDRSRPFNDHLLDWLHFRARSVPQRPRQLVVSPEVQAARQIYPVICLLERLLSLGGDLTPWLSNTVRTKRQDHRADLMFNHWQILHFHLSGVFTNPRQVRRTDPLLFAFIGRDVAVLLDVLLHRPQPWSRQQLLRILLETSPATMESFELIGIRPGENFSDDELKRLRSKGLNVPVQIDGRVFVPPGIGVVGSQHAIRMRVFADNLVRSLSDLKAALAANLVQPQMMRMLLTPLGVPVRLGVRLEAGHLILHEKNRRLDLHWMPCLE